MPSNKPDLVARAGVARMTVEGCSVKEITEALGIHKSSVMRHRQALGLLKQAPKPDNRAAVERMTRLGFPANEIAAQLGITRRTVRRNRAAAGISNGRPKPISAAEHARINDMLGDGVPVAEIARSVGRSPSTLWKRYKSGLGPSDNRRDCRELEKRLGLR